MNERLWEEAEFPPGEESGPSNIVAKGVLFEASLVLVAWGLGWLLQQPAWQDLGGQALPAALVNIGIGLAAVCPMFLALVVARRASWAPLRRLRQVVDEDLLPLLAGASLPGLFLLSVAAGLGEEMLFRAVLQNALADWLGGETGRWSALLLVSLLFGICHWITTAYGVFAMLIGLYLGMLYWVTGHLLAAVVAHAAYDFVALVWLLRTIPALPGGDHVNKKSDGPCEEDRRLKT